MLSWWPLLSHHCGSSVDLAASHCKAPGQGKRKQASPGVLGRPRALLTGRNGESFTEDEDLELVSMNEQEGRGK